MTKSSAGILRLVRGLPHFQASKANNQLAEDSKSAHVERIQTAAQSIAASSAALDSSGSRATLISGSTLKFTLEEKDGVDENVRFAELKVCG